MCADNKYDDKNSARDIDDDMEYDDMEYAFCGEPADQVDCAICIAQTCASGFVTDNGYSVSSI